MGTVAIIVLAIALAAAAYVYSRRRAHTSADRRETTQEQDILKHLYHLAEKEKNPGIETLSGSLHRSPEDVTPVLNRLVAKGQVLLGADSISLTESGKVDALAVVRTHRLWERYLADRTGVDESDWHREAERAEHVLSNAEVEALSRSLGNPVFDPHGDPIPQTGLPLPAQRGGSLARADVGSALLVVHVEDEPATVYTELLSKKIVPGVRLTVVERSEHEVVVEAEGSRHTLSALVAGNVTVAPTRLVRPTSVTPRTLARLPIGSEARVAEISPAVRGMQRRRLLDLGLVPGTIVSAEFTSPGGDPTAYGIRGALVALRRTEAELITVEDDPKVKK